MRSTGTPFRVREVHVWRLRDGKLISFDVHLDTTVMLAALHGYVTP